MNIAAFTSPTNGGRIGILVNKITGFSEVIKKHEFYGKTFISTGADAEDGENGFYVTESYGEVFIILESIKEDKQC